MHPLQIGAVTENDIQGHAGAIYKKRLILRKPGYGEDQRRGDSGNNRCQADVAERRQDNDPDDDNWQQQGGGQDNESTDQGCGSLPATELMPHWPDMTDYGGSGTTKRKPVPRERGISSDKWQAESGHESGTEYAFTDIDDYDPQREQPTLRAQRIRPAGVATAHGPDIHATAKPADDH